MVRTRVGYAGGTTENPTYRNIGDHSETIQIEYDPTQISYEELLDIFWRSHGAQYRPPSRQYMSAIFYHDEEQRRLAMETKDREEDRLGTKVYTEITPFQGFYLAEGYHQKYRLRNSPNFMNEFHVMYPSDADFIASTAAARVNGYLGGYGSLAALQAEANSLGLSPEATEELLDKVSARENRVSAASDTCPA